MGKGHVIYEKDEKKHVIRDLRFLFLSKKSFSKVELVPAGHVIHIYINDENISNIQFIDCNFDVFDFGFMSIFIHIQSKNTQVYVDNVSCNKHQELFIESKNTIIAENINDSGLLGLKGKSVNVSSLKNTSLEIIADNVSVIDYHGEELCAFDVKAKETLTLQDVFINTNKKIEVESPNIKYHNISLNKFEALDVGETTISGQQLVKTYKKNKPIKEEG